MRGIQKRKQLIVLRHLVPTIFVISTIGSIIIGEVLNNRLISTLIIFPYILANLISCIFISKPLKLIPYIFIAHLVLHLAYGIGFIIGFFRFIPKWGDSSLKDNNFNYEEFIKNTSKFNNSDHSFS